MAIRLPPGYDPFAQAEKEGDINNSSNRDSKRKQRGPSKLDAFSRSKIIEGGAQQVDEKPGSHLPRELLSLVPFKHEKDKLIRFEAHYMET